jgi:TRAP-type C4-dicarboxylate transport system substrate-binding protein
MKKISFVPLATLLSAVLLLGRVAEPARVEAAQEKPIELTFAIADPAAHPDIKSGFNVWADELAKRTNGRVKIVMHAGETLGKSSEQYDMVARGGVDITKVVGTHYRGRFPLLDIFSLPFTVPADAKDKNGRFIYDRVIEKYIIPAYFKDMKVLFTGRYQPNVIHLAKKPVRKLEDLKGLVISVPGGKTNIDTVKALGATPETVSTPDVYTALERGMVNGHVLPLSTQRSFKFYEVTKYVTRANFGAAATTLVLNKKKWDSLPTEIQKVIDELNPWGAALLEKVGNENDESTAKLIKERGLELIELSLQERTRWAEATAGIEREWAAGLDSKGLAGSEMIKFVKQVLTEK